MQTAGGPPVKNPAECLACSAANWNCALDLPQESSAPVAGAWYISSSFDFS